MGNNFKVLDLLRYGTDQQKLANIKHVCKINYFKYQLNRTTTCVFSVSLDLYGVYIMVHIKLSTWKYYNQDLTRYVA